MQNNIDTIKSLLSSLEIREEGVLPSDFVKNLSQGYNTITSGILQEKLTSGVLHVLQPRCSMLTSVSFPRGNVSEVSLFVSQKDNKWRKIQDLKIAENSIELYLPLSRLESYDFSLNFVCEENSFANFSYICIPDSVTEKDTILSIENIVSLISSILAEESVEEKESICTLDVNTSECCINTISNIDAKELRIYVCSRYPVLMQSTLVKTILPDENGLFTVNLPTKTRYSNFRFDLILKNNTTISYGNNSIENFPDNYKSIIEYFRAQN